MKLYQLLQSFEFEEIFPTVNVMFPNAQLHRDIFEKAFDMLCNIQPITSKKVIKFELMEDPDSNDMFVGANDSCFQSTWDVCLGKEVKKGKGADLNDVELAANCLLNVLFIGRHPQGFDKDYKKLLKKRKSGAAYLLFGLCCWYESKNARRRLNGRAGKEQRR